MSKNFFNSLINEGTCKMLKLVQRVFEEPGIFRQFYREMLWH